MLLSTLAIASLLSSLVQANYATLRSAPANSAHMLPVLANGTVNAAFLQYERDLLTRKYSFRLPVLRRRNGAREAKSDATEQTDHSIVARSTWKNGANVTDPLVNQGILYTGDCLFGTPSQDMILQFDTGSSDLWVASTGAAGASATFDTKASSTYKGTKTPFTPTYGGGSAAGTLASDVVSIAGLTVQDQWFGAVTVLPTGFVGAPHSGILGLAFSALASSGKTPLVQNLIAAGLLAQDIFAFYLTRNSAVGSTITLGGLNPSQYIGDITYTPVISQTYWEINATSINVNGVSSTSAVNVAVDTGTTFIYVPKAMAAKIYANVPTASSDTLDNAYTGGSSSYYQFHCDTIPDVSFSFAGSSNTYSIAAEDFNIGVSSSDTSQCIGAIIGMDIKDASGQPLAILGDVFLRNWYSVYNFNTTSPSVGFALSNSDTV